MPAGEDADDPKGCEVVPRGGPNLSSCQHALDLFRPETVISYDILYDISHIIVNPYTAQLCVAAFSSRPAITLATLLPGVWAAGNGKKKKEPPVYALYIPRLGRGIFSCWDLCAAHGAIGGSGAIHKKYGEDNGGVPAALQHINLHVPLPAGFPIALDHWYPFNGDPVPATEAAAANPTLLTPGALGTATADATATATAAATAAAATPPTAPPSADTAPPPASPSPTPAHGTAGPSCSSDNGPTSVAGSSSDGDCTLPGLHPSRARRQHLLHLARRQNL